mgnify:CR=1 FL=1
MNAGDRSQLFHAASDPVRLLRLLALRCTLPRLVLPHGTISHWPPVLGTATSSKSMLALIPIQAAKLCGSFPSSPPYCESPTVFVVFSTLPSPGLDTGYISPSTQSLAIEDRRGSHCLGNFHIDLFAAKASTPHLLNRPIDIVLAHFNWSGACMLTSPILQHCPKYSVTVLSCSKIPRIVTAKTQQSRIRNAKNRGTPGSSRIAQPAS